MRITSSVLVHAPIERVFEVFTDLSRAQERLSNVVALELLTPGPVGVGTRWRETRRMMGQEATEEMSITAYDPPREYEVVAESHGARYRTHFGFLPEDGAIRVTMDFSAEAVTVVAKLLSITGILFRSATEKALQADLDDLRRASEAGD